MVDNKKVAILQANLGAFDTPKDPVKQSIPTTFHRFTDKNFPPIGGLTPRLQYRIPKYFGWEMFPDYDYYIWLDGSVSLLREDCATWYLEQLGDGDIAFFKHPTRRNIRQEVAHIEEHLKAGKPYITARYKGGLHKEQLELIQASGYKDRNLYASTVFIYRNTLKVRGMMHDWWHWQSRYYTCDQIALPWVLWRNKLTVKVLQEPLYKSGYISLVSNHKWKHVLLAEEAGSVAATLSCTFYIIPTGILYL